MKTPIFSIKWDLRSLNKFKLPIKFLSHKVLSASETNPKVRLFNKKEHQIFLSSLNNRTELWETSWFQVSPIASQFTSHLSIFQSVPSILRIFSVSFTEEISIWIEGFLERASRCQNLTGSMGKRQQDYWKSYEEMKRCPEENKNPGCQFFDK